MRSPGIVAWGGGPVAGVRRRHAEGARVVAWPGASLAPLREAGLPFDRAEDLLGPEGLTACAAAARGFARVWPRLPLRGGEGFRELARWRSESLLWTCEGFLAAATAGPRCAWAADLCLRLIERLRPSEIDVCGLAEHDAVLLGRAATVSQVLFHGPIRPGRPMPVAAARSRREPRTSLLARLLPSRRAATAPADPSPLLVLAPAAEHQRFAAASPRPLVVPSDDLAPYETARGRQSASAEAARLGALHASLAETPALAASYAHRGVVFDDLARDDLAALLFHHLPARVVRLERLVDLLAATRPALLVSAVDDADERRTQGLAARACGVAWAVLRRDGHGEADRADAGPQPLLTRSLVPTVDASACLAELLEAVEAKAAVPTGESTA